MRLIYGLDIGTTSIGWAVVRAEENKQAGRLEALGVRIFPEARDPDGTPLNQTRRAKRTMRRQLRRRRDRRRSLNELLTAYGLLPAFGGDEWGASMTNDPYALRAKGLTEALTPHELGRALYHLAKRRHFKERDLAEVADSEVVPEAHEGDDAKARSKAKAAPKEAARDDETKSTEARKHLAAILTKTGETLGQHLSARAPNEKRRGEHATRAIVEEEFSRLVAAQKAHHTILKDAKFHGAVQEAIFMQRPVFWRKSTLGKCRLMPSEALCPKGSWLSQQRVMLEKLNNLSIAGGNARRLESDERAAILDVLQTQKSMSWSSVRKALEPIFKARGESTKYLKFNLEAGDEKGGLKGNSVEADLAKILGSRWKSHSRKQELRDFIPAKLWEADYGEIGTQRVVIRPEKERVTRRKMLAQILMDEFDVTKTEGEALVKLHFPQGWESFSTEALKRILPKLEQGERFGALMTGPDFAAWRDETFPERDQPTGEILDRLPSPRAERRATFEQKEEATRIKTIRNPTVVRVQNELRKVVNNLIGVYGKPDLIRVELARDVGKSKDEREEISKGMRKKEGMRKRARADLISNGIADPSDADIEKWLLWKESSEQCVYTGDKIGFADLFSGNPRFEVEHIWPRSKSLDNSFGNKTLCRKDLNLAKGDRTPFEYFQGRPDDWQAAKDRIWKMTGKDGINKGKANRFCAEAMPEDFAARQLNDTSYAARQAMTFLKRLWPDVGPTGRVYVQAVTGKVTAQLRRRWGLNHILAEDGEKTRADHRHHAIDALVIACADGGYTQKLSRYFEAESNYRRGRGQKPADAIVNPPWPSIRADAEAAVATIVVSHRVRKKVSGPLHKETNFGDTGEELTNSNGTYRLFVSKKKVETLSRGELDCIRDEGTRSIIKQWVDDHGGDPKKAFATYPLRGPNGPEIRKARLVAPQKLRAMAELKIGYASTGNNHHIAIYRMPDGKIEGAVISLMDAVKRVSRREPVVQRTGDDGRRLIISLSLGDTFYIPEGDRTGYWTVKSISGNGQVFCKPINNADASPAGVWGPSPAPLIKLSARKVSIDPIGRVRPAND